MLTERATASVFASRRPAHPAAPRPRCAARNGRFAPPRRGKPPILARPGTPLLRQSVAVTAKGGPGHFRHRAGPARRGRSVKCERRGVTLVEVLTVLFILSLVALPFTRMFSFGMQSSIETREHVVAYNLAREKIEELHCLRFDEVLGDFAIFKPMYQKAKMFDMADEKNFHDRFNDIFTEERLKAQDQKDLFRHFGELYLKHFRREYLMYPDDFEGYRRVTVVDDQFDRSQPPRLKKVEVRVFDKRGRQLAQLVTLVGRPR